MVLVSPGCVGMSQNVFGWAWKGGEGGEKVNLLGTLVETYGEDDIEFACEALKAREIRLVVVRGGSKVCTVDLVDGEVKRREEFGEEDDVSALACGVANALLGAATVCFEVIDTGELDCADSDHTWWGRGRGLRRSSGRRSGHGGGRCRGWPSARHGRWGRSHWNHQESRALLGVYYFTWKKKKKKRDLTNEGGLAFAQIKKSRQNTIKKVGCGGFKLCLAAGRAETETPTSLTRPSRPHSKNPDETFCPYRHARPPWLRVDPLICPAGTRATDNKTLHPPTVSTLSVYCQHTVSPRCGPPIAAQTHSCPLTCSVQHRLEGGQHVFREVVVSHPRAHFDVPEEAGVATNQPAPR